MMRYTDAIATRVPNGSTTHGSLDLSLFKRKPRIPVEVFALVVGLISTTSSASTGSSWSQQPSWAGGSSSDEPSPTHRTTKSFEPTSDISPFAPGSHNVALDLGQIFLMGDLGKFQNSLGTQIHYTYGVSDIFGFDSSIGYSQFSNGMLSMVSLLTGLRLNLSWYDKVIPYGICGLGFYRPSYQDNTLPASDGSNSSVSAILFGIHFGAGVDLALSRNLFFGTALTFYNMFGTSKTYANGTPLNVGGSYVSFFLHVGATF